VVGMAGGRALQQHPPRGRETANMSTWPSVSRPRRARRRANDLPHPRKSRSPCSSSSRVPRRIAVGGAGRHCSVVSRTPAPSTRIAPPSRTKGRVKARPRRARRAARRAPHRPHGPRTCRPRV
jgi:hypothetical protein